MRGAVLLLTMVVVTGVALAAVPAVEARGFCSDLVDDWCESAACVKHICSRDLNPVCVTEPCPRPIP